MRRHEWRLNKNEDTQIDIVRAQEISGARELVQRHPFIEPGQNVGVDSFQTHGDFETAFQAIAKAQAIITDECRMGFDNQALEVVGSPGDCRMVFDGDRARIKKAAAVLKLQYAGRRKLR